MMKDWRALAEMIRSVFKSKEEKATEVTEDFLENLVIGDIELLDHPVFFTLKSKEYLIRQLYGRKTSNECDRLSLKWPELPPDYHVPAEYKKTNVAYFIKYLRDEMEHHKDRMEQTLAFMEDRWPKMWIDLSKLSNRSQRGW